jgi:hypothetical protein
VIVRKKYFYSQNVTYWFGIALIPKFVGHADAADGCNTLAGEAITEF